MPSLGKAIAEAALAIFDRGLVQDDRSPDQSRRLGMFGRTPAGVWIDHDVAMTLGAVNACVRAVAETVGVLDWGFFRRDADTRKRERRADHPLDRTLQSRANPEMSSQTFRETIVHHALLRGNGYAEIVRDGYGRTVELWPLPPNPRFFRLDDGRLVLEFTVGSRRYVLDYEDVYHVKGLGPNGVVGYDVISYMATTVGYGIAVEEFSSEYFANGAIFSTVLEHPKRLSDEAQKRLVADMEENYTGRGKRWRFRVLEEGMKATLLSADAEKAQLVAASKLSVEQVARWFRVPPHKIALLDRATFNNIEHLGIEFIQDSILPWARRCEAEADYKCVGWQLRPSHFTKMNVASLARGDLKSRNEAYRMGRQWGWLSPNHIMEMEGGDPIPEDRGGDALIVPLAYRDSRLLVLETEQAIETGEMPTSSSGTPPAPPDDDGDEPGGDDDAQRAEAPAAFRNTIANACRRIAEREERYCGRRLGGNFDAAEAMRNHRDYAVAELMPIVRDMARMAELEIDDAMGAVRAVIGSYTDERRDQWARWAASGYKPSGIADGIAARLEDDVIEAMVLRAHAAVQAGGDDG